MAKKYLDETGLGYLWTKLKAELTKRGDTLPIGTMVPYGNEEAPTNWLRCDGSEVSRTRYAELFAVIGTSYGAGDGSTTFNLPNKKGRDSIGLDENDEDFNTIGKKGGEKKHQLTLSEMPSSPYNAGVQWGISNGYSNNNGAWATGYVFNRDESLGITTKDQPHNNVQPYEVDCWIIKAFQSAGVTANTAQELTDSTVDVPSCKAVKTYIEQIGGTGGGTTNYEYLSNLPKINSVTLTGNKTSEQLGLQPAGDYATKAYVDELFGSIVNGNEVSY